MSISKIIQLAAWCMYEWGSHAFSVIIVSSVFSVYFITQIAPNKIIGTFEWSNAITIASIIIAISGPILGAIADQYGRHKLWLFWFTFISISTACLLWYAYPNSNYVFYTLMIVVIGIVAFEIATVFYNTYLFFLAPANYIGRLSGWAFGLGYLGGIAVLTVALFGFIKSTPSWLNTNTAQQIRICGPLVAIWFTLFALPLFILVPNTPSKKISIKNAIPRGFKTTTLLFKNFREEKNILIFLLASMFYNDGLTTLFSFGGIYLSGTLQMSLSYILIFIIAAHLIGGLGAICLGWADDYFGSKFIIQISLFSFVIGLFILLFTKNIILFWIIILFCAAFIGPIQAASRSLMVRIAPPDKISEMFGLYAFSGKASAFLGPWLFGLTTFYFQSQRAGMATILFFFIIGGIILNYVNGDKYQST